MENHKIQNPVENHIGDSGYSIPEELNGHVFAKRWVKKINKPADSLTCRYEYFSHSVVYDLFFKGVCVEKGGIMNKISYFCELPK